MARRSRKASRAVTSCLIPMDVLIRVRATAADRDALVGFSDSDSAALRSAANRGGYSALPNSYSRKRWGQRRLLLLVTFGVAGLPGRWGSPAGVSRR